MRTSPVTQRRLAWLVFGGSVALVVGSAVVRLAVPSKVVAQDGWGTSSAAGALLVILSNLAFPVAGILIARQQPSNRIAWILLTIGASWGLGGLLDEYARYGLIARPGSLPRPDVAAALGEGGWVPAIGLIGTFLILLFPDGHLPSPRWRIVGWASALIVVATTVLSAFTPGVLPESPLAGLQNPIGIEALRPFLGVLYALLMMLQVCILASAASLVVRFRRSRGVERLQLKWLATAGAAAALTFLVTAGFSVALEVGDFVWLAVLQDVSMLAFGLIPLAIGVAVLKHGLYGIDVVINKALVFGTLGAFITGVYVAIVVGVGTLVGQGNNSLALSIAATAIVAVGFQPVRERVQRLANRLVYGQRATPYEVLSDFASRMGGAYGSAELLPRMARTVAEGIGAARVDIWLKIGPNLVAGATWPEPGDEAPGVTPINGDEFPHLEGDRVVPVSHHGDLLGAIAVTKAPGEPLTPTEDKLLADVAAQAGLVLRNARLIEELRGSRERLVKTQDTERRRLERNLHDGAQQSLVSVALILQMTRAKVRPEQQQVAAVLDKASEQLATAIEELRELARGIHPAILTERGLGPAITSLAERADIPVTIRSSLNGRLNPTIEGTVYFVVAEALTNIAKYAEATAATITVGYDQGELVTTIVDNGIGGADPGKGSGLAGLVDRIAAVNGHLDVHSPPGAGTRVVCRIPVTRDAPARSEEPGLTLPRPQPEQGSPSSTPARAGTR